MLLFTRVAPPKVPKRRSRAGCTYCKDKKKKCDEHRPKCSRCAERGLSCVYEPVKPRQRRKRDSAASIASARFLSHIKTEYPTRRFSEEDHGSDDSQDSPTQDWHSVQHDHILIDDDLCCDPALVSPLESTFDTASLMAFPTTDLTSMTSTSPMGCEFLAPDELEEEEDTKTAVAVRRDSRLGGVVAQTKSHHPDLAMIAPIPVSSPLLEFTAPSFTEFSNRPNRRALVDHFCNVLSHLIVFREESGNPFQQLVLPLTQKSSPVMNAIYALASAHLEYRGVENGEKSLYFHNQAIQGLSRLIECDDKFKRNELLAAIMLLVYYEVLVQKGRSNIVHGHLKGAMTIMCRNPEPSDPTGIFLERAFRFYDVIAALSFGTAPLSTAPAAGCLLPFPPLGAPAASPLSNVDTLLGMATTLWPIIHRLSTLLSLKAELERAISTNEMSSKVAVLRTEFETTSKAIEVALEQWQPCLPPNFVPDESFDDVLASASTDPLAATTADPLTGDDQTAAAQSTSTPIDTDAGAVGRGRIHSILHNALAYRHSASVYLHRTIYGAARSDRAVQAHAHAALAHCVATVAHAGPMGALLWPLFVAACEAVVPADRAMARRAFEAIDRRQGMTNIQRAWEIVREVWRRADGMEATRLEEEGEEGEREQQRSAPLFGTDAGMGGCGLGMGIGGAYGRGENGGPDLWRRISEEMGVSIVFG